MKQATILAATQIKQVVAQHDGMKQAIVIAAGPGGLDLTVLGVPASMLLRRPQELFFPASFNPDARTIWLQMFADPIFQEDLKEILDSREAWLYTVKSYMSQCHEEDTDPFKSRRDPSVNNNVRNNMFRRRVELMRYIDRSRIFTRIKVIPTSARHVYDWLSNGNVRLRVSVQFEMEGGREALTSFVRSTIMKMLSDGAGGYSRNLLKNLTVGVEKITNRRATLYYTMEIKQPYHVPENKQTKVAKTDWFDKEFFNPMVRGHRFDTLLRRIKF